MTRGSLALGLLSFTVVLAGVAGNARADERTKEECISANESAQTLRSSGKLRDARAQLLVCIDKSCPGAVRDDCAERLNELERAIPTVVFTTKGAGDVDLTTVHITMDGAPLTERLDGSALDVDPGEHTFEFTAEGYPSVTKQLVIREGSKGRQEIIAFAPTAPPAAPAAPISIGTTSPPEQGGADADGDTRRIVAYALGGAGILGLGLGTYFGLRASSTYDDASAKCPSGSSSCSPEGVDGGKDAHTQAAISTVGFVAGGLLLGSAVVLYLTAPRARSSGAASTVSSVSLRPVVGVSGGGLRLGGDF